MTAAEKRIRGFCTRRSLNCVWQTLRCNGQRAVVETLDRTHHKVILTAASRLKGVRLENWSCNAGGVWEGYIYLQDAEDAKRIDDILAAETERCNNWNQVYHDCLTDGLDHVEASRRAESLYPTPTKL